MTISTTKTAGTDSVLINKDVKVDSFILPMSYHQPEDVSTSRFATAIIRCGKTR